MSFTIRAAAPIVGMTERELGDRIEAGEVKVYAARDASGRPIATMILDAEVDRLRGERQRNELLSKADNPRIAQMDAIYLRRRELTEREREETRDAVQVRSTPRPY